VIQIQTSNHAGRHSVGIGKVREVFRAITKQAAFVKADPELAGAVFTESGWSSFRQAICRRVAMESFGGSFPSGQTGAGSVNRADPDIAAGIFKQAKDIVRGQAIFGGIETLRTNMGQFLNRFDSGKAAKPFARCDPPFSFMILRSDVRIMLRSDAGSDNEGMA
jgi:hypothetical protein